MQIANYASNQMLFSFNRWGGGQAGNCDIGIGNYPDNVTNTDWKFTQSATNYVTKNLYIFVRLTNAPIIAANTNVIAPVIVTHPASRTNFQNSAAILATLASGTAPITYQWRKGGTNIATQTNAWLTFASVQFTNAGNYDVIASNTAGVATSLVAVLSVTNPPPPTGYDAWAAQITGTNTAYNQSATGDGYANLLKYATGSSPTNSDNRAQMKSTQTNGLFALKFSHNTNATDLILYVEGAYTTTNDAPWVGIATNNHGSWGTTTNVSEDTGTDPATDVVWDTDATATNRFLRLRVTRP